MSPAPPSKRQPASPGSRFPEARKRRVLPLLGVPVLVALVLAFVVGFSDRGVPDGAVAAVGDKEITQQQFDKWLGILAKAQEEQPEGAQAKPPTVPKKGDPNYPPLRDRVMEFLINSIWIQEEAEERNVTVTERQVNELFNQQKDQSFESEKEFEKFLKDSSQGVEDIKLQIKLTLLQEKLRERITPQENTPEKMAGRYEVDSDAVSKYYAVNEANFRQPEQRDVRVVVNKSREKVNQAKAALERDSSEKSWKTVAKRFSTDEATKEDGGLLPAVTQGQQEEVLDKAIFSASKGSIEGPVKTTTGFYIFQVTKITKEKTQPLSDVRESIQQTLIGEAQQKRFEAFVTDFRNKWQDRTRCRNGFRIQDCDNPPTGSSAVIPGQPAVSPARVASPGTAGTGGPLPQGPLRAFKPQPELPGGEGQLPGGLQVPGGGGAPPGAGAPPPGSAAPAP